MFDYVNVDPAWASPLLVMGRIVGQGNERRKTKDSVKLFLFYDKITLNLEKEPYFDFVKCQILLLYNQTYDIILVG